MKFEIAMTTYNRSDVLEQSLNSLSNSVVNEKSNLYISDDNSTDQKVKDIVNGFIEKTKDKFSVNFQSNQSNLGCDPNMCKIINYAFDTSNSPFVITIDSDVLYNKNWMSFMERAYHEMVKNPNIAAISAYDSRVHQSITSYNNWLNIKVSIGGLCAILRKDIFKSLPTQVSWDWEFVKLCKERGKFLLCSNVSLIQHIGRFGAHSLDGNMYDYSDTFVGE